MTRECDGRTDERTDILLANAALNYVAQSKSTSNNAGYIAKPNPASVSEVTVKEAQSLSQELPITSASNSTAINPVVKSIENTNFLLE